MTVGLAHTRDDLKSGPWLLRIYYIRTRLSELLLAQSQDAKRKSYIRVRSFHSGPNQTETPHTTRASTDLPPRKKLLANKHKHEAPRHSLNPGLWKLPRCRILWCQAQSVVLSSDHHYSCHHSSCHHGRNVKLCSHYPSRTAADKEAHTIHYYAW
jgi:hypothetical protein